MKKIKIFDTTLRDGEQCPGGSLNLEEKLKVARQLARMKVDIIEAGFAIASPGDFESVKKIAGTVKGPVICSLARTLDKDIDTAGTALKKAKRRRIHTFIATSNVHMKYKLKKNEREVINLAVRSIKRAGKYTDDIEFSPEDSSRTGLGFLYRILEAAIAAGATTVNIPDTVGYATPDEFGALVAGIIENVPNIDRACVSVHCHNDLGMAVANSLMAVRNGAGQVECTINGIGERAGNASLEEIVMALKTRRNTFKVVTGVETREIYNSSRLVSSLTGMLVQPNKAIVGANAFAHEAGIHQDGILKKRSTYEIMRAQDIGLKTNTLVLGKHSGRHAFKKRLKELGFKFTDADLAKAFIRFKTLADKKKEIYDEDLEAIFEDEIRRVPEKYVLDYIHVSSGNKTLPTATLRIKVNGEIKQEAACGAGPVDAAYSAILKIVGYRKKPKLEDYSIRAVTHGMDALGEVTVSLETSDHSEVTGRGASTDIIEASAKAYIQALNRLESRKTSRKRKGTRP